MIDSIDNEILSVLKENARFSFAEIGRIINLSPSAVRERVRKMEDSKVIKNYTVEIDISKIGYELEAFILLKAHQGKLKQVIPQITKIPEIIDAHRITGSENIHLRVLLECRSDLQKLLDKLMFYGDTNTFLILTKI